MSYKLFSILVAFSGEVIDMTFQITNKLIGADFPFVFVGRSNETFVGCERCLGIDHHGPLLRKHDNNVRFLRASCLALEAQSSALADVFPSFGETSCFEDTF